MDPVTAAIKFTLEITHLSSQDLRTLVENATLESDSPADNNAWLAQELLRTCATHYETDKTQLLSKWSEHIVTLESLSDGFDSLTDDGVELLFNCFDQQDAPLFTFGDQYTIDSATPIEENGLVDLNEYNQDYTESQPVLHEALSDGSARFLVRLLDVTSGVSKSPLRASAKSEGIVLSTEGALTLYRLINIANANPQAQISIVIESHPEFWNDPLNQDVIHAF